MGGRLHRVAIVATALSLVAACGVSSGTVEPEAAPEVEQGSAETAADVAERYAEAEVRTFLPVAGTADVPLPRPQVPPRPTGSEPALALGPLIETAPPAALADPPGPGRVLVATVEGEVLAVDLVAQTTEVVMDLRDRIALGGEQGLLGLAVDPRGDRLYLDYTAVDGDTEIRSWELDDEGLPVDDGEGVLHLRLGQPYETHNAGNLVFGPDGALWIATGDGGGFGDPGDVAQDDGSLLGKVLRVVPDPAGGIRTLPSNPDWSRPEIWGIGLRNPWRWSFDRATHRLWIADVGQNVVEEVSVASPDERAADFGWDDLEGLRPFEGERADASIDPVITYGRDDGCSVTGGYVYRGEQNPGLHGWYLFADFCGGWVRAVPADDPSREPVEVISAISSVVSFGELEDGELVALTAAGIHRLVAPVDP